jgi:hypothetical protein
MSSSQPEPKQNGKDHKEIEEERQCHFEEALENVNVGYGRALKCLAEHPSLEEQRDER